MSRDAGLNTLLDLDVSILDQGDGYWIKIEVKRLSVITIERPHGLSYSLTLHGPDNQRLLGFDNAHAIKSIYKSKYSGQIIEYDHRHRSSRDKGIPYHFVDGYQLLQDFFKEVDRALVLHRGY